MADNRIKIASIQIKNFRSIRNEIIKPYDFNIFVGVNDAGKSNILKALNLFFNSQTDYNSPFAYESDFTYLFPEKSHSTKEIKITLVFDIPETYAEFGEYTWTKVWRINNYFEEVLVNSKGEKPSPKSRVPSALRRIKYRYVPAVKSANYYKTLLGDLYKAVSSSLDNPLLDSATAFSDALKNHTKALSDEVSKRLLMQSELAIPSDLNDIFQALIFETSDNEFGIHIPLTARGDGIQARHIPIVLKYIAQQDQKSRNKGSMKVCTIWGFEEPENGLELLKSFQMADDFEDYSKNIQIFTSTHSPAFYMKKAQGTSQVFFVSKRIGAEDTIITTSMNTNVIADNMGLMPLVAPFIAEQSEKLRQAEEIYSTNILTDVPTIMVEGETDIDILRVAIENHSDELNKLIVEGRLRIICKNGGAGTTQLCDWAIAWVYSGFKSKLYILLDKDIAGIAAKKEIEESQAFISKQNSLSMKVQYYEPSDEIIGLYDKNLKMTYEIEHLLSLQLWKILKKKGFVQPRSDDDLQAIFKNLIPRDKTLDNVMDELVDDIEIRDTILTFDPKELKKKRIVEVLKNEGKQYDFTKGFKRTLDKLSQYFL